MDLGLLWVKIYLITCHKCLGLDLIHSLITKGNASAHGNSTLAHIKVTHDRLLWETHKPLSTVLLPETHRLDWIGGNLPRGRPQSHWPVLGRTSSPGKTQGGERPLQGMSTSTQRDRAPHGPGLTEGPWGPATASVDCRPNGSAGL